MTLRMRKTPLTPAQRPSNIVTIPTLQRNTLPPPPAHLEPPEAELWTSLVSTFVLDDCASLSVLQSGMEARGRARRCRVAIDAQGETIADERWGVRPHPLLPHERASVALFLQAMKALRLDTGGA